MKYLAAFFCGLLFAVGLGIGGMTDTAKVIGFLDLSGIWNPALVFVMGGAVGVTALLFPLILRRGAPVLDREFHVPLSNLLDLKLFVGAGLFGIGWGIAGYCPGPAVVSLVTLSPVTMVFTLCMLIGLGAGRLVNRR